MPETPESPPEPSHPPQVVDLLIVGGGINGAAIARDLAGRGLRVIGADARAFMTQQDTEEKVLTIPLGDFPIAKLGAG